MPNRRFFEATYIISNDPDHWRWRAEETRALAETFDNPEARKEMLCVSRAYDRMADLAEKSDLHSQGIVTASS
jgi:hypothetical protein